MTNNLLKRNIIYNINLLIINNKSEYYLYNTLSNIHKYSHNDLIAIDDQIKKIYLSHSINKGIYLLKLKNIDTNDIELNYLNNYHNNNKLHNIFINDIEFKLKQVYSNRFSFNLIPIYYTLFLHKYK